MFPRPPRELVLPVSFEKAARELLAFSNADDPSAVAARAVGALAQLVHHMNELVGEIGGRALLSRSVALSSDLFPWLAGTAHDSNSHSSWALMLAAMERQRPHAISEAFGMLLSTFMRLLGRLIGEVLVAHLLHDVWPDVFPETVKGTT